MKVECNNVRYEITKNRTINYTYVDIQQQATNRNNYERNIKIKKVEVDGK